MKENPGISLKRVGIEGTAIVVSILIAFAIDAAWETRQENERLTASIASLAEELDGNRLRLQADLERLRADIREVEEYVVLVSSPPASVSPDQLREMFGNLAPLRQFPVQQAAFRDLTSGGVALLKNGRTRRLVLEYGQAIEFHESRQRVAEEWFDRRAGPYDELNGDLVGMRSVAYGDSWAGRSDLRFDFDSDAFVGNRRYANLLASRFFRATSILRAREDLLEVLTDLEQALSNLQ